MLQQSEVIEKSIPASELNSRIELLQKELEKKELSGTLILQKTDLYYFSGTSQQGWLYVPNTGKPLLMVFKEFQRASEESAIENIVSVASPKTIPLTLSDYGYPAPTKLGMELDVLPVNLYNLYQSIFKEAAISDISFEIRILRSVKSDYEISKVRKAAVLSDQLAEHACLLIEEGRSEVEVAGKLEGYARGLGHQGLVRMRMFNNELFYGHLLSGDGAAEPSYLQSPTGGRGVSTVIGQGAGYRRMKTNEPVLVDFVFALDGYLSDHARIYSIGPLSPKLQNAHEQMITLQEKMKPLCTPGAITGELYDEMVSYSQQLDLDENFMGVGERRIRFTGHGVGLELDEFPFIAKGQRLQLETGMILALEPKVIFPGEGVVGVENTHLITENGLEPLSSYPDQVTEL